MIYEKYSGNIFTQGRNSIHDLEAEVASLLPFGMKQGHEWVALNPTRDDDNTGSFRINLITGKWADFSTSDSGGDIISLYAYISRISQYEAADEILNKKANLSIRSLKPVKLAKVRDATRRENRVQHIKDIIDKIWAKCVWSGNSPVEDYLKSSGFTSTIPYSIKYHPRLYHSPTQDYYPAMVASVARWSDGASLGLHRTYLQKYGKNNRLDNNNKDDVGVTKAKISPNKMMLGSSKGGAVMLSNLQRDEPLIIAEGIETALSVYAATGLPTWAALSASGMINVEVPPPDVTPEIIIAADNDRAGIAAANKLADRLLKCGHKVKIATPPKSGTDFNDLLLEADEDEVEEGEEGRNESGEIAQ